MIVLKFPLMLLYGLGVVILMLCALPFAALGFLIGFIRWTTKVGIRLSDRLFLHFT